MTVVAIDQKSLPISGQWPWPRNLLARLVRIIQRAEPAAIGINILMPEADALSPERLLAQAQVEDKSLIDALRALPTHDAQLARAWPRRRRCWSWPAPPKPTGMACAPRR